MLFLRLLLLLGTLLTASGCSIIVTGATTQSAKSLLRAGTPRATVLQKLGSPTQSVTYRPTAVGSTFPDAPPRLVRAPRVGRLDEYRVSGALLMPGDRYATPYAAEGMSAGFLVTGGLSEVVTFPMALVDVAGRSLKRYRLRLWYDPAEQLIAYQRREEPKR